MKKINNKPLSEFEKEKLFYIKTGLNLSETYDFSGTRITIDEYRELQRRSKLELGEFLK